METPNILIVNGSCGGAHGNTAVLLDLAVQCLSTRATVSQLNLTDDFSSDRARELLKASSGFVFGSGTYWDSWGSPLQKFLEEMTPTEGSDLWLGKPAGVIVTTHSVGGKGVLSRLQGVLNTFGAAIPPMSGLVYSTVNHLALKQGESALTDDLWRPDDIKVVCHNLLEACANGKNWIAWPVDRASFGARWLEG